MHAFGACIFLIFEHVIITHSTAKRLVCVVIPVLADMTLVQAYCLTLNSTQERASFLAFLITEVCVCRVFCSL